jgi:hypothetical protein
MSRESQFDREMDDIDQAESDGRMTREEAAHERRELQRDYRGAAEEAAENAYREELERW